jgi:hypothetical protein
LATVPDLTNAAAINLNEQVSLRLCKDSLECKRPGIAIRPEFALGLARPPGDPLGSFVQGTLPCRKQTAHEGCSMTSIAQSPQAQSFGIYGLSAFRAGRLPAGLSTVAFGDVTTVIDGSTSALSSSRIGDHETSSASEQAARPGRSLRELKRLRAEVAKAEADAIARRRLEGHARDGDTKNESSGTP